MPPRQARITGALPNGERPRSKPRGKFPRSALDYFEFNRCMAACDQPEFLGRRAAYIDDATGSEGAAIIDAHRHAFAIGWVGHAHQTSERKRAMRRSQFTSAVTLTACRGATFKLGSVIGGAAAINRSGCRLRGRRAIKAGVGRVGQRAFRSTVICASRSAKPSERQARRTCCKSGPTRKAHEVWQG